MNDCLTGGLASGETQVIFEDAEMQSVSVEEGQVKTKMRRCDGITG